MGEHLKEVVLVLALKRWAAFSSVPAGIVPRLQVKLRAIYNRHSFLSDLNTIALKWASYRDVRP